MSQIEVSDLSEEFKQYLYKIHTSTQDMEFQVIRIKWLGWGVIALYIERIWDWVF